jgi:hypothetical protein
MDFRDALFFLSYPVGEYSTSFVVTLVIAQICASLCARGEIEPLTIIFSSTARTLFHKLRGSSI